MAMKHTVIFMFILTKYVCKGHTEKTKMMRRRLYEERGWVSQIIGQVIRWLVSDG